MSGERSEGARDARIAWVLLALSFAAFAALEVFLLPRLTNVHFGDVEFTGWSGPMGSRLLRGERPYVDFVLPIPPGSFALLALLERAVGRPLLLEELSLDAILHAVMGLLAYVMARAVTSRRNAVLTTVATLVTVMELKKECAYDHTAQVAAWSSIAFGLWALLSEDARSATRRLVGAGVLAGLTVGFKQSTGVGCIAGWVLAFSYLAVVDLASGNRKEAKGHLASLGHVLHGIALGLAAVWLLLLALGSTARAFLQATLLDGSTLKGGTKRLLEHLVVYVLDYPAYSASLAMIALFSLLGARLVRRGGTFHLGDEPARGGLFTTWEAVTVGALVSGASVAGIWFLVHGPAGYPPQWIAILDALREAPPLALVPTCVVFAAHALERPGVSSRDGGRLGVVRTGHALNAVLIAAFSCSLLHNTSAPEFRPYYDNNALIPLTLTCAFVLLDRAALRPIAVLYLCLVVSSAAGNKYFRAMTATIRVGNHGYWTGMRVSDRGAQIVRAAARVRELTKPDETVLVLPEDLQIEALIGRPRPPLVGAVVFVDQYPPRLVPDDVARLAENPPKVIVIHPRDERVWQEFFRIWSGTSGAEQVLSYVLRELLPARYDRALSYPTTFHFEPQVLDVYVRREPPSPPDGKEGARR